MFHLENFSLNFLKFSIGDQFFSPYKRPLTQLSAVLSSVLSGYSNKYEVFCTRSEYNKKDFTNCGRMKWLSLILKVDLRYALKNRVTRRQDINKITSWNQIEEHVKYISVKSPLWFSRSSAT